MSIESREERTLLLLKPNSIMDLHVGDVISKFEKEGLKVVGLKMEKFSKERIEGFFIHLQDKTFFTQLVSYLSSFPLIVMVFEGFDAVKKGRELIGHANPEQALPNTIRKLYSRSTIKNCVHGPKTLVDAEREISYFFSLEEIYTF